MTTFFFSNLKEPFLETLLPERFSKWNRLLRTTAWLGRLYKKIKGVKNVGELDKQEIQYAEKILYKRVQMDSFFEEISDLKNNRTIKRSSRLFTLSCMLDEDDLIRLDGRLNNLQMDVDFKNPIILDYKHRITKLIIQHYHEEVYHHGKETVINNLRQKFWILHIRQAVKGVLINCQHCKIKKSVPKVPIMGQLPICRLKPTVRPFINSGLDYFGPILVTVKRSHEKRYGAIFTCMVTRAVHLEIANDLSTNSFIHVLRQFIARRGAPGEIYCDNGSNFTSAKRELFEALQELNQSEIIKFCSLKHIKWKMNPPSAPHMGGTWERLIQSVKKVMHEILTTRFPQEYVLRTVFTEAENIINSRPLTHVSIDSEDSEALTPNHFLIGPAYAALPCAKVDEKDLNLLSKWKAAQKLTDMFWRRWLQEYLPCLVKRTKWYENSKPIQEGDIVLIVDPNGPRNVWPKGKIMQLYPAKDGKIRIVDVQLANGNVLRRPVAKICILDVMKSKKESNCSER